MSSQSIQINIEDSNDELDFNIAYEIWELLKKEVKSFCTFQGTDEIHEKYISLIDLDDDCTIQKNSIVYFFPEAAGRSTQSAHLSRHWFSLMLSYKKNKVKKILKNNGFQILPPLPLGKIIDESIPLYVYLEDEYYSIEHTNGKNISLDSDIIQDPLTYEKLLDYQKEIVSSLILANKCGCHMCHHLLELEKPSIKTNEEEALLKMKDWLIQTHGVEPIEMKVYNKKNLVWFGSIEECFLIEYKMPDGFHSIGFTGPYTYSIPNEPLKEIKKGETKEHKYLYADYVAAHYLLTHIEKNSPNCLQYTQEEKENAEKIILQYDPCAIHEFSLLHRIKLIDEDIWIFEGIGSDQGDGVTVGGIVNEELIQKAMAEKKQPFCLDEKEERFPFKVRLSLKKNRDSAITLHNQDNFRERHPLLNALHYQYGPYKNYGWGPVRLKTLNDEAWKKFENL